MHFKLSAVQLHDQYRKHDDRINQLKFVQEIIKEELSFTQTEYR